jgi:hypothetical protein
MEVYIVKRYNVIKGAIKVFILDKEENPRLFQFIWNAEMKSFDIFKYDDEMQSKDRKRIGSFFPNGLDYEASPEFTSEYPIKLH